MRVEKLLSTLVAVAIIAALVFAPLAFGAVEPWAYSVLAVLAYSALALVIVRAVVSASTEGLLTPMLVPAALALLLLAVQLARLPAGLLGAVSPRAVETYQGALEATGAEEAGGFAPSLYAHATRDALIRLSAYVALFVATCACVRSRKHVTGFAAAIVAAGFAVSLFGIVQNLSGARKLYWWRELTHGGSLFGPFVSSNQFATYAGICLFVGVGLLLARGAHAGGSVRRWRKGLRRALTGRAHQSFLIAFAVAVMGAAVLWSLSRGGILALFLSFAGVFAVMRLAGFVRSKFLYVAVVVLVVLGGVSYLGWEPVAKRLSTLQGVAQDPLGTWRWKMYADARRMGLDFPALGTGAGTFLSVYPFYRTLPTHAVTRSPHNEYLHVFAETGFTGLAILLLAMGLLYARVIRGLVVRKNPYVRGFLVGGVGALLMVTLHSIVDFPMRSPAIAGTLAVAAGLFYRAADVGDDRKKRAAARQSEDAAEAALPRNEAPEGAEADAKQYCTPSEQKSSRRHSSSSRGRRGKSGVRVVLPIVVFAVIPWAFACHFALNPLRGQLEARLIARAKRQVTPNTDGVVAFVEASEKNIANTCPGNAQLYAELADFAREAAARTANPLDRVRLAEKSLELDRTAARIEPMNAEHHFQIAIDYLAFQRADLASGHAEKACELLPNDPWIRAYLAETFLAYGQLQPAKLYLEKAENLASARGIEEAEPSISAVREKLSQAAAR